VRKTIRVHYRWLVVFEALLELRSRAFLCFSCI